MSLRTHILVALIQIMPSPPNLCLPGSIHIMAPVVDRYCSKMVFLCWAGMDIHSIMAQTKLSSLNSYQLGQIKDWSLTTNWFSWCGRPPPLLRCNRRIIQPHPPWLIYDWIQRFDVDQFKTLAHFFFFNFYFILSRHDLLS